MSGRILVIDDEANLRTMIKLTLVHAGYEVETACDGPSGLAKFGDGKGWDVVLLDQRMPGMSGIDAQREIFKRRSDARLILITAFGSIDLALEAIQAGASDFLRKPFSPETLSTAVKTAIDKPVERLTAVPVGMACKEFTRTTINGLSFELDHMSSEEATCDISCVFQVNSGNGKSIKVNVLLHSYVMELVKAYSDSECVPGENSFWQAMCEEALADYLWQNAEPPPTKQIEIEDLSPSLERWIDSVLTVCIADEHA